MVVFLVYIGVLVVSCVLSLFDGKVPFGEECILCCFGYVNFSNFAAQFSSLGLGLFSVENITNISPVY